MPAKSEAQRAYLAHNFGEKWMKKHHMDNKGKLPSHYKASKKPDAIQGALARRKK